MSLEISLWRGKIEDQGATCDPTALRQAMTEREPADFSSAGSAR